MVAHPDGALAATGPRNTRSGGRCRPPRHETFPAEDGTALRRSERYGRLLSASRAGGLGFHLGVAVVLSRRRGCAQHRNPLGLAGFASFGFVFELLVVKEKLF